MPTVLLIAPAYPPANLVGSERIIKFEKYLPQSGFNTCVLTTRSLRNLLSDKTKHVYRAFDPGMLYRRIARHPLPERGIAERTHPGFRDWISWFAIPDGHITWLPGALLVGLKAVRLEKVDIIWSSSLPETAHLVAAMLAAVTRKPWVADFRDGWVFESVKPKLRRKSLRRSLEERLERLVVSRADAVVSVSEPITQYFQAAYPQFRQKCFTLSNGFDADDWNDIKPVARDLNRFRIVHTGAFTKSRATNDPRPFFHALASLDLDVRQNIEVLLIGDLTEQEKQCLAALGLEETVRIVGWVTKSDSLAYQLSADLLLLLAGTDKSVATSKLYEYLYARRPILAMSAPDTAAAAIIRETGAGVLVDPLDSNAIAKCLVEFYDRWKRGEPLSHATNIEHYSRKCLTGKLAALLKHVIEEKRRL
ncbi:MAG: glycosyltransferase [Acidobacteria bacterium]|nr:glycosyltransferase [Acidobacteriota bacterium]